MVRLFVEQRLHAGADIAANEGQAHYVVHVMRLLTGSQVALFNGRDGEWHARITMLGRSRVGFEVAEQVEPIVIVTPTTILVMLTSSSSPDDIGRAKRTKGISGFLTKPLTVERVLRLVSGELDEP